MYNYFSNTKEGDEYLHDVHLLWKSYCKQMVIGKKLISKLYQIDALYSLKFGAYSYIWIVHTSHLPLKQAQCGIWQWIYLEKILIDTI